MRLKLDNGGYVELDMVDYSIDMLINYELLHNDAINFVSIDRGQITDRYATTITFGGLQHTIDDLALELNKLRVSDKSIFLSEIEENIFGDHINHSGELETIITDTIVQESPSWNYWELTVTLLLSNPIYTTPIGIPTSLKCINEGFEGFGVGDVIVNESYYRNNWISDKETTVYTFTGTYLLSTEDTEKLLNYWRVTRGNMFTTTSEQFGVTNIFGGILRQPLYYVIFGDIKYTRESPSLRYVTIELIKAL